MPTTSAARRAKPTVTTSRTKQTWMEKAVSLIATGLYEDHRKVTGEQIRFWLRSKRLRAPEHPNAYGALILRLVQQGILRKTATFVASETPTSHGRARRVYAVSRSRSGGGLKTKG